MSAMLLTVLDAFWHLAMYLAILLSHTRHTAPRYAHAFHKRSSLPLILHMVSGLTEVARFHLRAVAGVSTCVNANNFLAADSGNITATRSTSIATDIKNCGTVLPDTLDLILCLVHSWSVLMLARTLRRGIPRVTRPSYQAGALLRPVLTVAGVATASAPLHNASVRVVNGFAYTRVIIWLVCRLELAHDTRTGKGGKNATSGRNAAAIPTLGFASTYALAVFLAGILAVHEGGASGGVVAYVALVAGIVGLNGAVSADLDSASLEVVAGTSRSRRQPWLATLLMRLGFAELHTIRQLDRAASELHKGVTDEYVPAEEQAGLVDAPLQEYGKVSSGFGGSAITSVAGGTEQGAVASGRLRAKHISFRHARYLISWCQDNCWIHGNEMADPVAKAAFGRPPCPEAYASFSHIKRLVKAKGLQRRRDLWEAEALKPKLRGLGKQHMCISQDSLRSRIKPLALHIPRLSLAAYIQPNPGIGYLRAHRFTIKKKSASDTCFGDCKARQTTRHLLLECRTYSVERDRFRQTLSKAGLQLSVQTLFDTTKGREALQAFLCSTRVGTAKWYFGITTESTEDLPPSTQEEMEDCSSTYSRTLDK